MKNPARRIATIRNSPCSPAASLRSRWHSIPIAMARLCWAAVCWALFAAGDCARYAGGGLDAMTAQAAVRKGKLVAENIRRLSRHEPLAAYDYQALGYFLSLGPLDGIGWLGSPGNILSGAPAFTVKIAVEAQFNLFLRGVDTYTA